MMASDAAGGPSFRADRRARTAFWTVVVAEAVWLLALAWMAVR